MRNIRLFVEFASVIMPGAVFLLVMTLLFAPMEFLSNGFPNSALGITTGLAFSFAAGHLLQGVAQLAIEPLWLRIKGGWAADWAIQRFSGRESKRYLTVEQIEQLELQYPLKLGIPFPKASDASDRALVDAAISHAEAFLYSAKVTEHLDDIVADYKLNKGLLTAFALVPLCVLPAGIMAIPVHLPRVWLFFVILGIVVAAICAFARMEYHSRKYAQSLYLQFLTTPAVREGGGKGNDGGGGAGVMPMAGMGRAGGLRGQTAASDDDAS